MPRGPRIDCPGLLQHVIVRGIEKRKIFSDEFDYKEFLERLGKVLEGSMAKVLAWTLMPNHVHLLIKTGIKPLSIIMRRLLTGYALYYNKKYKRVGYLFQGRYKSTVCEIEPYLLELLRYIHLNPIRAGIVRNINELDKYRWNGHSVILGIHERNWQDTEEILIRFGKRKREAINNYRRFIMDGLQQGKRKDLTGGGLIRSLGGVGRALLARANDEKQLFDQRILGNGEFVGNILKKAEENTKKIKRISIEELIRRISEFYNVDPEKLIKRKRQKKLLKQRAILVNIAIDKLGIPGSKLANKLRIDRSGISRLNRLGEKLIEENKWILKEIFGEQ